MQHLTLLPYIFLRAPMFSIKEYQPEQVSDFLKNESFRMALYLASPLFFKQLESLNFAHEALNKKQENTLLKYINRMCFRSTPFGGFSSFTILEKPNNQLSGEIHLSNHIFQQTRPDEVVIHNLQNLLSEELPTMRITVNPTIYQLGREFRYMLTFWNKGTGRASYSLAYVPADPLLRSLLRELKKKPQTRGEIRQYLMKESECSTEEAYNYLDSMLEEQVLYALNGRSLLVNNKFENLHQTTFTTTPSCFEKITHVYDKLRTQSGRLSLLLAAEQIINSSLAEHGWAAPRQHFCVTTIRTASGYPNPTDFEDLSYTISFLNKLSLAKDNTVLTDFISRFRNRFDLQEVPLLKAVDPDAGILYGHVGLEEANDLLVGMPPQEPSPTPFKLTWTDVHRLMAEKWFNQNNSALGIELEESDLESINIKNPDRFPVSLPVLFSVSGKHIIIEAAGGVSAIPLIGRFTTVQEQTLTAARQLASLEQANNPDVIFAEVSILSDQNIDNINRRMPLFNYEIPINTAPAGETKQLALSDLYVSVNDNQLILRSHSLKKQVIPRLSTAYNTALHDLGLFRLLCDLQYQGIGSSLIPDLELFFPGLHHYPRVSFKRCILSLAKWRIKARELQQWRQKDSAELLSKFHDYRLSRGIPKIVAWSKGDQQLVFDFQRDVEVFFFLDCVKNEPEIWLKEFLGKTPGIVTNAHQEPMAHQLIAVFHGDRPSYGLRPAPKSTPIIETRRNYFLGSDWIYFKIYCVPSRANDILVRKIYPIIRRQKMFNLRNWFFVRYTDSAHHLRLRFQIEREKTGTIVRKLKDVLSNEMDIQLIHEYQTDTYKRELERYGANIISDVESFFTASSDSIITFMIKSRSEKLFPSYHSLAFVDTKIIISTFFPSLDDQIEAIRQIAETFLKDHQNSKKVKIALDQKYRNLQSEIKLLMVNPEDYYIRLKLHRKHQQFKIALKRVVILTRDRPFERRTQLAADLLHMHLNRLFKEQQRYQELIIYYCLYKFLWGQHARSQKDNFQGGSTGKLSGAFHG